MITPLHEGALIRNTPRLLLRPWLECDAEDLYALAKDPLVGPIAGWAIHTGVENSRQIIKDVLSQKETYAVTLKTEGKAIGSIGLMIGADSHLDIGNDEAEIGYWIGVPYWGRGLIPEAMKELMRHAFEDCNIQTIWCGYCDGNEKSKRVQEKCGMRYHHTERDKAFPFIHAFRTEHVTCITKAQWQSR